FAYLGRAFGSGVGGHRSIVAPFRRDVPDRAPRSGYNRPVTIRVPLLTVARVVVLLGAVVLAGGWPAQAARPARDPLAQARDELRAGHYERARRAAEALTGKRGPGAVRAAVVAARAERRLGLLVEARRRLEE